MEHKELVEVEEIPLDAKKGVSKMIQQAKDFSAELVLTVNTSGVTSADIAFGVANLVANKVKQPLKKQLDKYL